MLAKHFPQSSANPTSLIFKFGTPVCTNPAPLAKVTSELRASSLFTQVTGPLNPVGGITLTPAQYAGLCGALGPANKLPATPPPPTLDRPDTGAGLPAVPGYRRTIVSPDGRTVQFLTGLQPAIPAAPRR